jgi:hypothetical protein
MLRNKRSFARKQVATSKHNSLSKKFFSNCQQTPQERGHFLSMNFGLLVHSPPLAQDGQCFAVSAHGGGEVVADAVGALVTVVVEVITVDTWVVVVEVVVISGVVVLVSASVVLDISTWSSTVLCKFVVVTDPDSPSPCAAIVVVVGGVAEVVAVVIDDVPS